MNRSGRIAGLSLGLLAAGAVFGGVAALIAMFLGILITGGGFSLALFRPDIWVFVVLLGALFGGALLPIAAWGFLRRVPLGMVVVGTVLGTILGGVLAWSLPLHPNVIGRGVAGAVAGFLAACLVLRLRYSAARAP